MVQPTTRSRSLVLAAVVGFAVFGAFWGVWGASIPRVRAQAGLDDARLGLALLFVGAGALPSMLLTGKVIDRCGLRVAALTTAFLGLAGTLVAFTAQGLVTLSAALALVGATSGAADVANNTIAGRAEREGGRPVITRIHAVFSAFVVIGSLGSGLLAGLGTPLLVPFGLVAAGSVVAALLMMRALAGVRAGHTTVAAPGTTTSPEPEAGTGAGEHPRTRAWSSTFLIGFGLLGALAFASENAHQTWSAVFVTDALGGEVALSSVAPAVFAGAAAATRFAVGGIGVAHARSLLVGGSTAAVAGALILAVASTLALSVVGLGVAAVGTAVLFPTVLAVMSARVDEARRGHATSTVTTLSYLGFVLSPVYVGLWSGLVGIRGAMVAVAGLGMLLLVLVARSQAVRAAAAARDLAPASVATSPGEDAIATSSATRQPSG